MRALCRVRVIAMPVSTYASCSRSMRRYSSSSCWASWHLVSPPLLLDGGMRSEEASPNESEEASLWCRAHATVLVLVLVLVLVPDLTAGDSNRGDFFDF